MTGRADSSSLVLEVRKRISPAVPCGCLPAQIPGKDGKQLHGEMVPGSPVAVRHSQTYRELMPSEDFRYLRAQIALLAMEFDFVCPLRAAIPLLDAECSNGARGRSSQFKLGRWSGYSHDHHRRSRGTSWLREALREAVNTRVSGNTQLLESRATPLFLPF